jgi:hypothetical protein
VVNGKEETALAVFWVTDGVDRCKVGFLSRHLVKHKDHYDGKTVQIVEFLETLACPSARAKSHRNKGVARAVLLEAPAPKTATATAKEDPNIIYIDRTKRTPTKKRSSTKTPKKDSAKKCVVEDLI